MLNEFIKLRCIFQLIYDLYMYGILHTCICGFYVFSRPIFLLQKYFDNYFVRHVSNSENSEDKV